MFYHDDESFYSFIFRRIITFDRSYSFCVLGRNGFWLEVPSIPNGIKSIFECDRDDKLMSMLQSTGLIKSASDSFENPIKNIPFLKRIFDSNLDLSTGNQGTRQVAFCPKCINDMLLKFGYGYFKSRWLFDDVCLIHNEKLVFIPELRRKDGVNIISSILKGGYDGSYDLNHRSPIKRRGNFIDPKSESSYPVNFNTQDVEYYIMPCLKFSFLYLMSGVRNNFVMLPYKNLSYQSMTLIIHCVEYFKNNRDINDHILSNLFSQLQSDGKGIIDEFISEITKRSTFSFGFINIDSFKVSVLKRKFSNCSKCYGANELIDCPKNLIIERFSV